MVNLRKLPAFLFGVVMKAVGAQEVASYEKIADELLLKAISSRDAITFKKMIRDRPQFDINHPNENTGQSYLHRAVVAGSDEIVDFILSLPGIDVNMLDKTGSTALMAGVCAGASTSVWRLLKDHRTDANIPDVSGTSPLWQAVHTTNVFVTESIIILKGDGLITNTKGWCQYHANLGEMSLKETAQVSLLNIVRETAAAAFSANLADSEELRVGPDERFLTGATAIMELVRALLEDPAKLRWRLTMESKWSRKFHSNRLLAIMTGVRDGYAVMKSGEDDGVARFLRITSGLHDDALMSMACYACELDPENDLPKVSEVDEGMKWFFGAFSATSR
jgi:hypothetical protein